MLKKTILLSAGIAATLLGGQAMANTGYLGAALGTSKVDDAGIKSDVNGWQVEGAVAMPTPLFGMEAQLDGFLGDAEGDGANFTSGTAHLGYRNDNFQIGGFVNLQRTADLTYHSVGAEAQAFLGSFTLAGTLGYLDDKDDSGTSATFGDVSGKFFITDNFSLGAHVSDFELDNGATSTTVLVGGLGGEYKFSGPVSVYAKYEHSQNDDTDYNTDNVGVGVRYNFGTTLKDRNRKGANLAETNPIGGLRF